jgi:hypothetical protein
VEQMALQVKSKFIFKMKKLFFYSLLLLNTILYSQSNLQFNQVLTPNLTISGSITIDANSVSSTLSSSNLTVPTGNVWKIESIFPVYITTFKWNYSTYTYSISQTSGSYKTYLAMLINGSQARPNLLNEEIIQHNAIWLKAGDQLSFQFSAVGSQAGPFTGGLINIPLSIIEFNVVP